MYYNHLSTKKKIFFFLPLCPLTYVFKFMYHSPHFIYTYIHYNKSDFNIDIFMIKKKVEKKTEEKKTPRFFHDL